MTISVVNAELDKFMPEEIEAEERIAELKRAIAEAAAEGLPPEGVEGLRKRALSSDPPAAVEPSRVRVTEGALA